MNLFLQIPIDEQVHIDMSFEDELTFTDLMHAALHSSTDFTQPAGRPQKNKAFISPAGQVLLVSIVVWVDTLRRKSTWQSCLVCNAELNLS